MHSNGGADTPVCQKRDGKVCQDRQTGVSAPPMMIRDATLADAPAICAAYNSYVGNGFITFDLDGKPLAHFVAKLSEPHPAEAWVVATLPDGSVAGYGCLFPYSDRCGYKLTGETSVYLLPQHCGQGF